MARTLSAILLGGVLMFAWGFVSNVVLPLGRTGMKKLEAEPIVLAGMRAAVPESGLYVFPFISQEETKDAAKSAEWKTKVKEGPSGLLFYTPSNGPDGEGSATLGREFASNVVCALLIVLILQVGSVRNMGARFVIGGLVGFFGAVSISASLWIWYGYSEEAMLAAMLMETVGGLVAALPAAFLLKRA